MPPRALACLLLSAAWSVGAAENVSSPDGASFYAEQVYPIFQENCFRCHGEEPKLKGNFRLTSRDGLLQGGDLGPAFEAADPSASRLLRMVSYQDDEHQMPPKAKLPDAELEVLRRWIQMGAPYAPALEVAGDPSERHGGFQITPAQRAHWAYRPLTRPEVPQNSATHPIDAFLLARLEPAGLHPNGPAPAGALARRLHYNLTGLPPQLEEVRSFASNVAREGLQKATLARAEELLSRPSYGEAWARHWLDLVRYAESNGFERDNPKPHIWRYRDYVVNAFRNDLPYDRFILEQLAGDELPEPTLNSLTATGFHRLMSWDDEPADREQHLYDVLADNLLVTAETFLGTTLGCARCHDHKVDPFSQRDYYSFLAFFQGVSPYQTPGTIVPWATAAERVDFASAQKVKLQAAQAKLDSLDVELRDWLDETGRWSDQKEQPTPRTLLADARDGGTEWSYTLAEPDIAWTEVGFRDPSWQRGPSGFGTPGTPAAVVGTPWSTAAIWARATFGLTEIPETLDLTLHHDEDVVVYLNGVEIYQASGYLTDYTRIPLGPTALAALQTGRNVLALHCRQTGGGQYVDAGLSSGPAKFRSVGEAVRLGGNPLAKEAQQRFGRNITQDRKRLLQSIEEIRREIPGLPLNAVTEAGTTPKPLHVHLRGSAHSLGALVEPAFPAILASASSSEPVPAPVQPLVRDEHASSGRRLALARWLTNPQHPLTARVMVNRVWQHHFGRGLVRTANDFGKLGEAPTHPELLDWLASEFVDGGWSIRKLHLLILSSEAALRSSTGQPEGLQRDPQNDLFWRFDMRRLSAEEVRDSILSASGLLQSERIGGPWVYPPLPPEVLSTASRPGAVWPVSPDPQDHVRRSLYIHVKRSLRHPFLADFDQADTDSPCPVRFATTVPTQSLAMLNSGFVNDQARLLAKRLQDVVGIEAQAHLALTLAAQREPSPEEVRTLVEFTGRLQTTAGLDEAVRRERLALLALNLNEFLYLD